MEKCILKTTSSNIDENFFEELLNASQRFGRNRSIIFKDITSLAIHAVQCGHVSGILTEYQDHKPTAWKKLFYTVDENEIELFTISRQKYKISVSKLAFIGFLLFWHLLMQKYAKKLYGKKIEINLNSYNEYKQKMSEHIKYFKKRLNIVLLE
ncbi:MAG: hypothetical protein JW982_16410 [Spirochaetes bacterium]|nr:hypothetical protein [Spirochaetota bacterium]